MSLVPRSWSTQAPPEPVAAPAAPLPAVSATVPAQQGGRRRRMGEILLAAGVIEAEQLAEALEMQREPQHRGRRLGQVLALLGHATEREIAVSLAQTLGLEHVDLARVVPDADVVRLLPQHIVERTGAIALDRHPDGALIVASSDPTNVLALDDVRLYARANDIMVVVATATQVRELMTRAWSLSGDASDVDLIEGLPEEPVQGGGEDGHDVGEDAPVVRLVNQVLADATRMRASDIHLERQRDGLRIRYRVDGLLRDVMTAPARVGPSVVSRIKIMAGLDIAERRVPQDGRARIRVDGHDLDTRVSTLPALHGEKVVVRILARADGISSLDDVGLEPAQLVALRRALAVPQGLVLITGPTGSGKTTTLYSAINETITPEKNVITLEDPVEVQLAGITQVQINPKAGLTFESGLRSVLRQDPDVVLVGEVRDAQTAELALKAALTGHLVLTTLHTSSAVGALTRLVDMGVAPFLVASSLTAVVAQRLVRVPCPSCASAYVPDDDTLSVLGLGRDDLLDATPVRGAGCPECGQTGYRGRTAVYEVLEVDAALRSVLLTTPTEAAVGEQARSSGLATLRTSALVKAWRGQTTFEEAVRVTHSDHQPGTAACPACERGVEPGMVTCPWCALPLAVGACERCHRSMDPDWRVCPWCPPADG
jgi:type IV pilus assembly protein PilB